MYNFQVIFRIDCFRSEVSKNASSLRVEIKKSGQGASNLITFTHASCLGLSQLSHVLLTWTKIWSAHLSFIWYESVISIRNYGSGGASLLRESGKALVMAVSCTSQTHHGIDPTFYEATVDGAWVATHSQLASTIPQVDFLDYGLFFLQSEISSAKTSLSTKSMKCWALYVTNVIDVYRHNGFDQNREYRDDSSGRFFLKSVNQSGSLC